jgi:hypothetical protein
MGAVIFLELAALLRITALMLVILVVPYITEMLYLSALIVNTGFIIHIFSLERDFF